MFSVTAIFVSKPHPPVLRTQCSKNHKKQLVIQGFRHRSTVPKAIGELNFTHAKSRVRFASLSAALDRNYSSIER